MQKGLLPENEKISSVNGNEWTLKQRFSVVLEPATLSEMELTNYCRRMGLFVEQVKEWTENHRADKELREARTRLRELEKGLLCKEKALTEAATLLMLREKLNALWDRNEEG